MRSRVFRYGASLRLVAVVLLAACDQTPTHQAAAPLPPGFSERGDTPYISGTIVERTVVNTGIELRVRVPRGTAARVPEARVSIGSRALVRWTDGRMASSRGLRVGGRVTVWITGFESRSLPPLVTGDGFLLTR